MQQSEPKQADSNRSKVPRIIADREREKVLEWMKMSKYEGLGKISKVLGLRNFSDLMGLGKLSKLERLRDY